MKEKTKTKSKKPTKRNEASRRLAYMGKYMDASCICKYIEGVCVYAGYVCANYVHISECRVYSRTNVVLQFVPGFVFKTVIVFLFSAFVVNL